MPGSVKTKFCKIQVKKDFLFKIFQNITSHDHTNDHNLDLAPFHTSLNNDALATIFQLSRAGFFPYKCKSPHENEENGAKKNGSSILC